MTAPVSTFARETPQRAREPEPTPRARERAADAAAPAARPVALRLAPRIQAKLVVGDPGDRYEQEADRVADSVVGGGVSHPAEQRGEAIQTRARAGRAPQAPRGIEAQMSAAAGEARPLPPEQRGFFERRIGHDLSAVRVHAGPRAAAAAAAIGAEAFTRGRDVYFGAGQYRPDTDSGRHLLAHELTHTAQQRPDVLARQPTAVAVPAVDETPAEENEEAGGVAGEVAGDFQADPADTSRRIRDRLIGLDVSRRRAVVSRIRSELSEPEREQFDEVAGEVEPAGEAPAAPPASPAEGAAPRPAVPATARAAAPAAPAVPAPPTTPAAPARPSGVATAPGGAAARRDAAAAQAPARRTAAAEATSRAAQVEAEAATEASTVEAETAEAEGSPEVPEPPPSLSEIMEEPPQEEPEAESAAPDVGPVEPDFPSAPEEFAGGATPVTDTEGAARPEMGTAASGDPETPLPGEEPVEAVEPPVDAEALIAEIQAAPAEAEARLTAEADAIRASVEQRRGSLIGAVRANVSRTAGQVREQFAAQRTAVQSAVDAARTQIDTGLAGRVGELDTKAGEARTRIQAVFDDHRGTIEQTVDENITATEALHDRQTRAARDRTAEKARAARERGATQAASYPGTERGRVQAGAARGVAERTARKIDETEPDTVAAIEEVVAEIPAKFEEEGARTLQGYDEPLPRLLRELEGQIAAAREQLNLAAESARGALTNIATELNSQLDVAEAAAVARVEQIGPRAEAQVAAAARTALAGVDEATPNAMQNINLVAEDAVAILSEAEALHAGRSREFTDGVVGFIGGAADEGAAALQEAGQAVTEQLGAAEQSTSQSLGTVRQQVTTQLNTAAQQRSARLTAFATRVDQELSAPLATFETGVTSTETQTREGFEPAVRELRGKFSDTLRDADTRCTRAIDDGMVKNDEALAELGPKMREAASDAAWDYDHPILSTLADIGAIVAGVIVGILAVVVLVVVVIVAAKLLVAGLVAAGVAAATAALVAKIALIVVAVAGIALTAVAAYQGYQARRAAGQGFWEALGGGVSDVVGITDMRRAFSEEGLSAFDRGFFFGRGAATFIGTFFGRRLGTRINARLPRGLRNPVAGGRWARARLRGHRPGAGARPPASARPPAAAAAPPAAAAPAAAPPATPPTPASPRIATPEPRALPSPPRAPAPTTAAATPAPAGGRPPAGPPSPPAPPRDLTSTPVEPRAAGPSPPVRPEVPRLVSSNPAAQTTAPRGRLRSVPAEPRPAARTQAPAGATIRQGPRAASESLPPQQQPAAQSLPQEQQLAQVAGGNYGVVVGGPPVARPQLRSVPLTSGSSASRGVPAQAVAPRAGAAPPRVSSVPAPRSAPSAPSTTAAPAPTAAAPRAAAAPARSAGVPAPRAAAPRSTGPPAAPSRGTPAPPRGARPPSGPGGGGRRPAPSRGATAEGTASEFRYEYHRPTRTPVVEHRPLRPRGAATPEPPPAGRTARPAAPGPRGRRRGRLELDPETRRQLSGSRRAYEEVPHDPEDLSRLTTRHGRERFDARETELELPEFIVRNFPGRRFNPRGQQVFVGRRPYRGSGRPRGSTVPEQYVPGGRGRRPISVEAKNYNVSDEAGRRGLVRNATRQARQRARALPRTAQQHIVIDIRGQDISRATMDAIVRDLIRHSGGIFTRRRIHFLLDSGSGF